MNTIMKVDKNEDEKQPWKMPDNIFPYDDKWEGGCALERAIKESIKRGGPPAAMIVCNCPRCRSQRPRL